MNRGISLRTVVGLLAIAVAVVPASALATPSASGSTPSDVTPSASVSVPSVPAQAVPTPASASEPPAQPPRPAASPHLAPYIAGGLAVVAAGVGVAFGVLALDAKSDFEKNPTLSGADSGNNYAAYCDASFGAAVLAGVTSIVLFLADRNVHQDPATQEGAAKDAITLTASPIVVPHGAGAGAVVRF
jgi:hypothetical protein